MRRSSGATHRSPGALPPSNTVARYLPSNGHVAASTATTNNNETMVELLTPSTNNRQAPVSAPSRAHEAQRPAGSASTIRTSGGVHGRLHGPELVSAAIVVEEVHWVGRVGFELVADVVHVHTDQAAPRGIALPPDRLDQLVLADDPVAPVGEVNDNGPFGGRQAHLDSRLADTRTVGPDGDRQWLVEPDEWQAARPATDQAALVACVVSPGFDFADFELGPQTRPQTEAQNGR